MLETGNVQTGGFETAETVTNRIAAAIRFINGADADYKEKIYQFRANMHDYGFSPQPYPGEADYLLETYCESPEADPLVVGDLHQRAARQLLYRTPSGRDNWWLNMHRLGDRTEITPQLLRTVPTEQLCVGTAAGTIRFYNYGQALSDVQIRQSKEFVDRSLQVYGPYIYQLLSDVVIAPFDQTDNLERDPPEIVNGFVIDALPRATFINAMLLDTTNKNYDPAKYKQVLFHELGHKVHGHSKKQSALLLDFAAAIGWDVSAMLEAKGEDWIFSSDLKDFAPETRYVVHDSKWGTLYFSSHTAIDDVYGEPVTVTGKDFRTLVPNPHFPKMVYMTGPPDEYARRTLYESSAVTTRFALGGSDMLLRRMPETRDAWLQHMIELGYELAAPVTREALRCERRTGDDIVYPRAIVPERIRVLGRHAARS